MKVETNLDQMARRKLVNLTLGFGITLICGGLLIVLLSRSEITIFFWRITSHYKEVGAIVALVGLGFTMVGGLGKARYRAGEGV